ncbi:MAG: zf-HC2 domain-containing protein [Armatimonadota bacterium]
MRNLIEEHLNGTLDPKRRRAMVAHLKTCPACHRAVEEARLAGMVLHQAAELPPPPDLATKIKSAARFRLLNRPRPLHERALGSPAFLATCASLLCGAIICFSAILRVGSVPVEPPEARLAARPVAVHPMVAVQQVKRESSPGARQRPPVLKDVAHLERRSTMMPLVGTPARPPRSAPRLRPLDGALVARAERPMAVCNATHEAEEAVAVVLVPALQRTSLPGMLEPVSLPDRPKSHDLGAPAVDKSEVSPPMSFILDASEPPK